MFDIVLPVYNSLHHTRHCLESLSKSIPEGSKLIVIDDGSDEYVSEEIKSICNGFAAQNTEYFRNEKNMGYLKSCNKGITLGKNPLVVLMNSDTIVFPDTFQILKDAFDSDQNIGVINPISTWANWTRIPFPNGFNIHELEEYIKNSFTSVVDVGNASGFFFAVRRELFNKYGLFDEIFNPGYYEETDFCMRVLDRGYRVVVHKGLYVFHHGWGSFGEESKNIHMEKNKHEFLKMWGNEFHSLEQNWLKNDPLHDLKEDLATAVPKKNESYLKVIYILPAMDLYGGVISVIQLVNQLNLLGIRANIATYGKINEDFLRKYPLYFRPYIFESVNDLVENFPDCDIAVATAWSTVAPVLEINKDRGIAIAYFVQDFEPDFYETDSENYMRSLETYDLIHTKIVKSLWLKEKLKFFKGEVHQIPLGLNTDVFYDKKIKKDIHVIAHARPNSKRRNFPMVKEVFKRLKEDDESIILGVYGTNYSPDDFEVPVYDFGVLNDPKEVSDACNRSLIALDISTFQGFGRPGLEAMACGTVTVLTRNGGITEYAKHKFNTLLVNPMNIDEILQNVKKLLQDQTLRMQLIEKGFETSKKYNLKNEAKLTKDLFEGMIKGKREIRKI